MRRLPGGCTTGAKRAGADQPSVDRESRSRLGETNARTTDSREDTADGTGLLGLEDAVERHRDGCLQRAGARPRAVRVHQGTHRPAPSRGAGLPRRAGGARVPDAKRRSLRQYARDRPLPRSQEALVRGRHPRDGESSPVPVLGTPDGGASHRSAAERDQDRIAGHIRDALCRSGASQGVPRRHDRHQPRRQHDHRASVSLGKVPHVRGRGHGARGSRGTDRAGQPARFAASGSTCRR